MDHPRLGGYALRPSALVGPWAVSHRGRIRAVGPVGNSLFRGPSQKAS